MIIKSKTKVINISDIKRAIHLPGPLGTTIGAIAYKLMSFDKVNNVYNKIYTYQGRDFAVNCLKELGIKYEFDNGSLENIPKNGPFIIVSNHPFGGIDGLMLIDIASSLRPDFKVLSSFLLSKIKKLDQCFLSVNPFSDNKDLKSSFGGIRGAINHIQEGGGLGIFPAGEVSTYYKGRNYTSDKDWSISMMKLIKSSNVPVIPVLFIGENSKTFHTLGKIHPILRTIRLPHELIFAQKNKTIKILIGRAITPTEISRCESLSHLSSYLRSRTYLLEGSCLKANKYNNHLTTKGEAIELPKSRLLIREEVAKLLKNNLLFELLKYQCFLADYDEIPSLIHEIGIKREESFRATGEGTLKSIDLDHYDNYYKHLILWDKDTESLVGAYRLGFGKEILSKHGLDGFYVNELFRFKPQMANYIDKTIELGRSFVCLEYQKEPLSLMLLIKGLMHSVIKYPEYEYLMGPVSISNNYPNFYRSIMVDYLKKQYSANKDICDAIEVTNPFKLNFLRIEQDSIYRTFKTVDEFDRFLHKNTGGQYRLPTLLKKYIKLNSKIINFNVDANFNDCLDALTILKISDIPKQEIMQLSKDFTDKSIIYKRFGYSED